MQESYTIIFVFEPDVQRPMHGRNYSDRNILFFLFQAKIRLNIYIFSDNFTNNFQSLPQRLQPEQRGGCKKDHDAGENLHHQPQPQMQRSDTGLHAPYQRGIHDGRHEYNGQQFEKRFCQDSL